MKKINALARLSGIIIFITIILRYLIEIPDFIYGVGLGSGTTIAIFGLYEFRNYKRHIKQEKS